MQQNQRASARVCVCSALVIKKQLGVRAFLTSWLENIREYKPSWGKARKEQQLPANQAIALQIRAFQVRAGDCMEDWAS